MKIEKECVGCGQCVFFCPNQAISVCGQAFIGDDCTQCGIYISYCPVGAIRGDHK